MNHRPIPPSTTDPANAQRSPDAEAPDDHGGWGMVGTMVLCCIPMVVIIALAVVGGR